MKLIKMIIVDDEPIILRGLIETYPWAEMGFVVVGSATNAEEALQLVQNMEPQVVLTDIRMKQASGLTLVSQIKELNKQIVCVVMSAYKEFDYAKKACDMGVYAYLLKPIEEVTLKETMCSVYDYCISTIAREVEYDYLKEMLRENKDSFLNGIVERYVKEEIDQKVFIKSLEMAGDHILQEGHFVGICIGLDISYFILNQEEFETQGFALFNFFEKAIKKQYDCWYFKEGTNKVFFILNMKEKNNLSELRKLVSDLVNESKKFTNMKISAIASGVVTAIQEINTLYKQLQYMYNLACESGTNMLMDGIEVEVEHDDRIHSTNDETFIINSIRKGDEQGLKEAYIQFLIDIKNSSRNEYIKRYLFKVALSVEFFVYETYGRIQDIKSSFDNFYTLLQSLSDEQAKEVLFQLLNKVISIKNEYSMEKSKKYFSDYVSKALEFIDENLVDEELNITNVAEHVYLSPVYFGRLFKSTMNISFKQYVLNKRIKLAEKKILEGNSNIITIGNEVGIPNSSYFTQVFKKTTGYLPSEYKKEMTNEGY